MESGDNVELHKFDAAKHQLFFVCNNNTAAQVFEFPLGCFTNQETRDLACEVKIRISAKTESHDIRFVKSKSYEDIINKLRPQSCQKSKIVHIDGRTLVNIMVLFLKQGLNISCSEPLYVIKIEKYLLLAQIVNLKKIFYI